MRLTRFILYDSYRSACTDLQPLFSSFKNPVRVQQAVRRFLLNPTLRYSRPNQGVKREAAQRRAQLRTNFSLLLREARRRGDFAVAEAALGAARLPAKSFLEPFDTAWAKDALATCRDADERRQIEHLLRQCAPTCPFSGGAVREKDGAGEGIAPGLPDGALSLPPPSFSGDANASESSSRVRASSAGDPAVLLALAGGSPSAGSALISPAARAGAALAGLSRRQAEQSAAPSPSFTRYFVRQGIVGGEGEALELFAALRARPRAIGFRVQASFSFPSSTMGLLRGRPGISRLTWLPAWSGAHVLDAAGDPAVFRANRLLLRGLAAARGVAFQGVSSMLPVHFLAPRPGDSVLDLCAAPGGKAAMLADGLFGGVVAANDADGPRAAGLAGRLRNYAPGVLVSRARGEAFAGEFSAVFDAVLVDAPCAGEGRGGAAELRRWHPRRGLAFVGRQRALLRAGLARCRPGGRVVYATCSLNPLENEAVVAAVLREAGGLAELEAPPGLFALSLNESEAARPPVLSPGLPTWAVPSPDGGFYDDFAEARAAGDTALVGPELFPRTDAIAAALERCCRRVLPHRSGGRTEGFFIAILRKKEPPRGAAVSFPPSSASSSSSSSFLQRGLPWSGGGGGGGASLFRAAGFTVLPTSSPAAREWLRPFFQPRENGQRGDEKGGPRRPRDDAMRAFLSTTALSMVWRETDGLRLVAGMAVETARRMPSCVSPSSSFSSSSSSAAAAATLLELGVLAFNAAGELTEAGARLLGPYARSRVLRIPFPAIHLLLSRGGLEVRREPISFAGSCAAAVLSDWGDPTTAARRATSNGLLGRPPPRKDADGTTSSWQDSLISRIAAGVDFADGIAIAAVEPDSTTTRARANLDGDGRNPRPGSQGFTEGWFLPVRVSFDWGGGAPDGTTTPALTANRPHSLPRVARLQLLLSTASRERVVGMIGRLHAHQRRAGGGMAHLRANADFNPGGVMAPEALFGAPIPTTQRQYFLFGSAANTEARGEKERLNTNVQPKPLDGGEKKPSDDEILEL